mmetsp:Transcript_71486/g.209951  ORF Transcript_71486/g.209951 Transcript_71486/m.209951 type:complete len:728 (+) Transcript_71486:102-2285(+)
MGQKCCSSGQPATLNALSYDEMEVMAPLTQRDPEIEKAEFLMIGMGSPLEMEEKDLSESEMKAHHKPHRCTDVFCTAFLVASILSLGFPLDHCIERADLQRLHHGFDWNGELCGVDRGVRDKPFVYYCLAGIGRALDPSELQAAAVEAALGVGGKADSLKGANAVRGASDLLDVRHPICVSECPSGGETFHACFQREVITPVVRNVGITGTFSENITYTFSFVQDYDSLTVGNRYCIPSDPTLMKQLKGTLETTVTFILMGVSQVIKAWPLVLFAAVFGLCLGYIYLFAVNLCSGFILYFSMVTAVAAPLLFGLAGLHVAFSNDGHSFYETHALGLGSDGTARPRFPSTGDPTFDVVISSALLAVGCLLACFLFLFGNRASLVQGSIEAACDCLFEVPGLLALPLVHVILRALVGGVSFAGLCWLLSTGQVQKSDVTSSMPGGLSRTLAYTSEEIIMIVGYLLVAGWLMELVKAYEQWVYAYVTQMWFFNRGRVDILVVLRAFAVGAAYHAGTLAFGAAILSLFQGWYYFLSLAYLKTKEAVENGTLDAKSKVVKRIVSYCTCFPQLWDKLVRFMNKNTYLVVAINSENFCSAAQTALSLSANEAAAIGTLEGVTVLFQFCGVASMTSLGTWFTWTLATTHDSFCDPSSKYFTAFPEFVTLAASVVCLMVSWTFMSIFDTVSDAILFCWAYDRKFRKAEGWPPKEDTPDRLKKLLATGPYDDPIGLS